MRSMQRALALAAALIAAGAPGVSSAGWNYQQNGPHSKASVDTERVFKPEVVTLAPKLGVANLQRFQQLESHNAGIAGPNGPGKPAIDRYVAGHNPKERSSSIATDTD